MSLLRCHFCGSKRLLELPIYFHCQECGVLRQKEESVGGEGK